MIDLQTELAAIEPLVIMRSIKRSLRGQGRQRYPITRTMLQQSTFMLARKSDVLTKSTGKLLCLNMRAAMCTAWFGLLRCSEFTLKGAMYNPAKPVGRQHVSFLPSRSNPQLVSITIPDPKVDPDPPIRQGFVVRLYAMGTELCPVQALVDLFDKDPSDDPNRPLFDFRTAQDRAALSPPRPARHRFATHASTILSAVGFDDTTEAGKRISTHSFR